MITGVRSLYLLEYEVHLYQRVRKRECISSAIMRV